MKLIKRSAPFCGACNALQAQLDAEGYEYETIDITHEPEAIEKYGLTSVPVLDVNGKIFSGPYALVDAEDELE